MWLELWVSVLLLDWHSVKAVSLQDWHSVKTSFTGLAQYRDWLYRTGTVPLQDPYRTGSVKAGFTGLAQCRVSVLTALAQCQDGVYRTGAVPRQCPYRTGTVWKLCTGLVQCHGSVLTGPAQCQDWLYRTGSCQCRHGPLCRHPKVHYFNHQCPPPVTCPYPEPRQSSPLPHPTS